MIPRISEIQSAQPIYQQYLDALRVAGFTGGITTQFSDRLLVATDNSIYQVLPQAVIFPKSYNDTVLIFATANQALFCEITFAPKGGGTGILGQTLSDGITIDCSRYLRDIIELNVDERWVRVQPGIALGELNAQLSPHGLFFAPYVSSADRATLGGMVSTDAAGLGSRVYGKTSNHVLSIKTVLIDGTTHEFQSYTMDNVKKFQQQNDIVGAIYRGVEQIIHDEKDEITHYFQRPLGRHPTGYNLDQVLQDNDTRLNLNYLLSGSEGTLAFIAELKLNLLPIPRHRHLFIIKYKNFRDALSCASDLLQLNPTCIETIGDKVMSPVKEDVMYPLIKNFIDDHGEVANSLDFMEFRAYSSSELNEKTREAQALLDQKKEIYHYTLITDPQNISLMWEFRNRALGVLNNFPGNRKPVGFIEDSLVPLYNLPAYVNELTALLDKYNIQFGAYGHCDVGCLHIRPLLDLTNTHDEALMQKLYVECFNLVEKYNGVLWGEHGRGFRSQFGERHFGAKLFHAFRQIKTIFDPLNRLNPGKLFTPLDSTSSLVNPYGPLRAHEDRKISPGIRYDAFPRVMQCNGNESCMSFQLDTVMCPSEKSTQNRLYSPKGRAVLMREWLKQLQEKQYDVLKKPRTHVFTRIWNQFRNKYDFSHEVYDTMRECLECKACATACPVKVNVPDFKSRFLEQYFSRYQRPIRDFFIAFIEHLAPWQALIPKISNFLTHNFLSRQMMRLIGLVDLPLLNQPTLKNLLTKRNAMSFDFNHAKKMSPEAIQKSVVLLPDVVTAFYDANVVAHYYDLLTQLGYRVFVMPFMKSGKSLHSKGYLTAFCRIVNRNVSQLNGIAQLGFSIVGIDPSIALCFRDEYARFSDQPILYRVQLMQEFLSSQLSVISTHNNASKQPTYYLLSHCSEKSLIVDAPIQWQTVFKYFNLDLKIVRTGCCGMAGSYGYETNHQQSSIRLFELSWLKHVSSENPLREYVLSTGYSCRHQSQRIAGFKPKHPAEILFDRLSSRDAGFADI